MKLILSILMFALITASLSFAQDTTQVSIQQEEVQQKNPTNQQQQFSPNKIYFGGNMLLTVGSYTRIGVYPLIGYKFTPKLSAGIKIGYEYISDNQWAEKYTTSNYGGSIFARYRIIPQLYAHMEYAQLSYELYTSDGSHFCMSGEVTASHWDVTSG
jgi:hypothetical protein